LEQTYEEAVAIELKLRGIAFQRQDPLPLTYKGVSVAASRLDFLIEGKLVLEIKACETLLRIHKAQVISYLKATGLKLGLLANINVIVLKEGLQRVVLS
jgi:GxxExxY protein